MSKQLEALESPSKRFRSTVERGIKPHANSNSNVDREFGPEQTGVITNFAVISRTEALGHGYWIDEEMLRQTADAINFAEKGAKVRFTHPDMSGDGLGSMLGRATMAYVSDGVVYANLIFSKSAHSTPDGNLAEYVMQLAEEDPDAFGASIAFAIDLEATQEFAVQNGAHLDAGGWLDLDSFESPDELNTKNLPHVRLAELHAVDIVDSPAANPQGLFHKGPNIAAQAEQLLSYSLGLTPNAPSVTAFSVDPDRMAGFVARFLNRNGLSITKVDQEGLSMSEDTKTTETPEAAPEANVDPQAEFAAKREQFVKHFGATDGSEYLAEGLEFADALEFHVDKLDATLVEVREQLASKDAEIAELNERFNSLALGEDEPAEFTATEDDTPKFDPASPLTAGQQQFAASLKAPSLN